MVHIYILIVAFLMLLISFSSALYDELYRPQLHYSPPTGWINDPNGIVYHDGVYHLFCQHNPNDTAPGNIHWIHAISFDLVHWKNLGIALAPTNGSLIFSGGAIIDHGNVTGLQEQNDKKTLLLVFTAHDISTTEEKQWLAYSNDGPNYKNFKIYENNPIIPNPNPSTQKDFRDPAVFKYKDHFVVVVAAHDRVMIYNSPDLLKWTLMSEFGTNEGSHIGVWECPSLFSINVRINGTQVEKWILIISLKGNAIPTTQYFIGSFDGEAFTNENSKETVLWLDYGPDSYAGVTYDRLPDGRRIFISWMNRWQYSRSLNFNVWNGQSGLAREVKLNRIGNRILLSSLPVREVKDLRAEQISKQNVPITTNLVYEIAKTGIKGMKHLVDVEMTLDLTHLKSDDTFDIIFAGRNDNLTISLKGNDFTWIDRKQEKSIFQISGGFGRLQDLSIVLI